MAGIGKSTNRESPSVHRFREARVFTLCRAVDRQVFPLVPEGESAQVADPFGKKKDRARSTTMNSWGVDVEPLTETEYSRPSLVKISKLPAPTTVPYRVPLSLPGGEKVEGSTDGMVLVHPARASTAHAQQIARHFMFPSPTPDDCAAGTVLISTDPGNARRHAARRLSNGESHGFESRIAHGNRPSCASRSGRNFWRHPGTRCGSCRSNRCPLRCSPRYRDSRQCFRMSTPFGS
jgi:hypothetical protein